MDTNESSLPFVLQYVNAPCDSGKTYQIIQALLALYQSGSTGKCFYVAPTVALVEQTHKELVWLKVPSVSIYLEKLNETQTVRSEIFKAMQGHKGFLVLCVTYAGFEGTAVDIGEATKSSIEVYCDEIPKADRYERMLLPYRYKELLLPIVEAIDCPQETLVELVRKNISLVKEIARRNTDDGDAPIKELTRELVKGYRVFTLRNQWEKLVSDNVDNDCHGLHTHKNALDVVVMHNIGIYKGFKKVIFFGANADKTLFLEYHRCKSDILIEDITDHYANKLRYLEHPNGDKLKVIYVFPHRIWSKAKANSFYDDNSVMTQNEEFVTSAAAYVAKLGVPYGYVCNNNSHNNPDIEELFKKHFPTGRRIPVRSHGSNDYCILTGASLQWLGSAIIQAMKAPL